VDYQLGQMTVLDSGGVAAATSKVAVDVAGGSGSIAAIVARDNRGIPSMTRGLNVTASSAVLRVGSVQVTGQTTRAVNVVSGADVQVSQGQGAAIRDPQGASIPSTTLSK
jgi:hypothetical protein